MDRMLQQRETEARESVVEDLLAQFIADLPEEYRDYIVRMIERSEQGEDDEIITPENDPFAGALEY